MSGGGAQQLAAALPWCRETYRAYHQMRAAQEREIAAVAQEGWTKRLHEENALYHEAKAALFGEGWDAVAPGDGLTLSSHGPGLNGNEVSEGRYERARYHRERAQQEHRRALVARKAARSRHMELEEYHERAARRALLAALRQCVGFTAR